MCLKIVSLCLGIALAAATGLAQSSTRVPNPSDMYCSGVVTNQAIPHDTYLISGEQSNYRIGFAERDLVYINRGSGQGAKVGDEFLVMRQVQEPLKFYWFHWQPSLARAMGTAYKDLGRVRVINVQANVSIAQVVFSCDYMQRGDIAQPFAERPAPPFKEDARFDHFAPPSGGKLAMVVMGKYFSEPAGANSIVYVNLGSGQGVKVGDYFRMFRYQGLGDENPYQTYGTAYKMWGFGHTPKPYGWKDLPREILGEGIVLRVSPNAATVLITLSLREIYPGDYVEVE